jgi:hypothetical protein
MTVGAGGDDRVAAVAALADITALADAIRDGRRAVPAAVITPPGLLAAGGIGWIRELATALAARPETTGCRLVVDCGSDAARAHVLATSGLADPVIETSPAVLMALCAAAAPETRVRTPQDPL